MAGGRGVRAPVPERSKRRGEGGLGVYAGETTTNPFVCERLAWKIRGI